MGTSSGKIPMPGHNSALEFLKAGAVFNNGSSLTCRRFDHRWSSRFFLPVGSPRCPIAPKSEYHAPSLLAMTDDLIVLVEDNEDDVFFMRRALKGAGITAPIHVLTDGQQATDYLTGPSARGARSISPSLVFLDLKLPYCTGFEVLEAMRRQGTLESTQVVILTSSPEERDRRRAHELGAAAYLVKPPTPAMLKEVFASLPRESSSAAPAGRHSA